MSNPQYVVVFYPDDTLRVEVVGPFRSEDRAEAAARRLVLAIDPDTRDGGARYPHVLTLITESEAVDEYAPITSGN